MPTIKQLRKSKNLTREQLATMTGFSIATIANLEQGKSVYRSTLQRVAEKLGVSENEIEGVNVRKVI